MIKNKIHLSEDDKKPVSIKISPDFILCHDIFIKSYLRTTSQCTKLIKTYLILCQMFLMDFLAYIVADLFLSS